MLRHTLAHKRAHLLVTGHWACVLTGHAHPRWLAAVNEQAAVLAHTSNLFHTESGVRLML